VGGVAIGGVGMLAENAIRDVPALRDLHKDILINGSLGESLSEVHLSGSKATHGG